MGCYRTGKYSLQARPCIFQPGNVTGWGSERVNELGHWNGCGEGGGGAGGWGGGGGHEIESEAGVSKKGESVQIFCRLHRITYTPTHPSLAFELG